MIVIVVLGMLVGIAAPRMDTLYQSVRFYFELSQVRTEIAGLSSRAYLEGRPLRLEGWPPADGQRVTSDVVRLTLPEGWRVLTDQPILYREDGVCFGGAVVIRAGLQEVRYRLEPPRCKPA